MIGWQNAAALWALPLAAVPFVVHLLRTHHAKRVAFPSLRFVQPSRTAAVRMRLPSDVLLMLVRIAIVALAVGALAGPIVLTEARTAAWNARTARAVVVDVSDSMRVADGSGGSAGRRSRGSRRGRAAHGDVRQANRHARSGGRPCPRLRGGWPRAHRRAGRSS